VAAVPEWHTALAVSASSLPTELQVDLPHLWISHHLCGSQALTFDDTLALASGALLRWPVSLRFLTIDSAACNFSCALGAIFGIQTLSIYLLYMPTTPRMAHLSTVQPIYSLIRVSNNTRHQCSFGSGFFTSSSRHRYCPSRVLPNHPYPSHSIFIHHSESFSFDSTSNTVAWGPS